MLFLQHSADKHKLCSLISKITHKKKGVSVEKGRKKSLSKLACFPKKVCGILTKPDLIGPETILTL